MIPTMNENLSNKIPLRAGFERTTRLLFYDVVAAELRQMIGTPVFFERALETVARGALRRIRKDNRNSTSIKRVRQVARSEARAIAQAVEKRFVETGEIVFCE